MRSYGPILLSACLVGQGILASELSAPQGVQTPQGPPTDGARPVELRADASLKDMIAFARAVSPELEAARHRHLAAVEEASAARALPDPTIRLNAGLVPIETRVGPQYAQLAISQTIPGKGKRNGREGAANADAEARRVEVERLEQRLAYEISVAYYDLYLLQRSTLITRDNRDILVALEKTVRKSYETGKASYSDLIRTQVEIGRLENDLRSLQDRHASSEQLLDALLHRPRGSALPALRVDPGPVALRSDDALRRALVTMSPELSVIDATLKRDLREIELARVAAHTDWTVSLQYFATGPALDPRVPGSGDDPIYAGVTFSLPLSKSRYQASERGADRRRQSTVARRSSMEDRLSQRLERVLYEFRNADREILLYRDTLLPKGSQSFHASQTGVRTGTTGVLDLVDAQRVLLQFQLQFERALTARGRALAELQMLIGEDVLAVMSVGETS